MKKITLFVICMMLCGFAAAQNATWLGNSYIIVSTDGGDAAWYNGSGTGNPDFSALGNVQSSIKVGGQIQSYGDVDGANNPAFMKVRIDDAESQTIQLNWYNYASNNNWFGWNNSENLVEVSAFKGIGLGEHTLSVWFYKPSGSDNIWDSNGGSNFVATFSCTGWATSVENIELDVNAPMFTILGQPVPANYKGIVIQNGHKFVVR